MNDWFTVDKIDSDTFAVSEYKHWEETHCYLLCGTKKALLIDTGLGISNIGAAANCLTAASDFGSSYSRSLGSYRRSWIF